MSSNVCLSNLFPFHTANIQILRFSLIWIEDVTIVFFIINEKYFSSVNIQTATIGKISHVDYWSFKKKSHADYFQDRLLDQSHRAWLQLPKYTWISVVLLDWLLSPRDKCENTKRQGSLPFNDEYDSELSDIWANGNSYPFCFRQKLRYLKGEALKKHTQWLNYVSINIEYF